MNKLLTPKASNCKIFEEWYENDANGNKIHYKTSDGYEIWYEYDGTDNQIHCKTSDGFE